MGFRSLPFFASSSGWAEFENASALTQGRDSALTHSDGHPKGFLKRRRPPPPSPRFPNTILFLSPRHSALACRACLPRTLRRDPWGSEASRVLHRHRGGPNLKMLPLSLRAEILHSLTATATPRGKKMEGGRGLLPPGDRRKF